jgi:predicted ABC-type ATPase
VEMFKRGNDYLQERVELHQKIMEHFLSADRVQAATPREGAEPVLVMLGGRGGSGKSRFEDEVYSRSRCIVLDADEIKKMLPEYKGWNAAVVHEESSDILDVILQLCLDLRLNVVLDATMKSATGVSKRVRKFKSQRFRIEAHYMYLPRKVAAKRAAGRFCAHDNGRYVPVEVILGNTSNESNFDSLRPLCDAWSFWNNDVPRETRPQYISGRGTCALLEGRDA